MASSGDGFIRNGERERGGGRVEDGGMMKRPSRRFPVVLKTSMKDLIHTKSNQKLSLEKKAISFSYQELLDVENQSQL